MFELHGSDALHKHTHTRVDAMWRLLLCNQAQWLMKGRNAALWWVEEEEEEACLGKVLQRQSAMFPKSSGGEM